MASSSQPAAPPPSSQPQQRKADKDKPTQSSLVLAAMRAHPASASNDTPTPTPPPPLIDVGVNLADASYNPDRADVLRRARRSGVRAIVVTGCSLKSTRAALRLCEEHNDSDAGKADEYPVLRFTAGVHPHNAKECDGETLQELRVLAGHRYCSAVGECGLDFNRNFSPPDVQEEWFARQVRLAVELRKPLFMHCRDAGERFAAILGEAAAAAAVEEGGAVVVAAGAAAGGAATTATTAADANTNKLLMPVPGVLHCFTGNAQELRECLDLGLHIGITGWVCDERAGRGGAELASLLPTIPRDRLMVETDSPYLTPRTIQPSKARPHRNEPALLPYVLDAVSGALQEDRAEVARRTSAVAARFFGLAQADVGL
jgi:TatD DNase family protein